MSSRCQISCVEQFASNAGMPILLRDMGMAHPRNFARQ
jgi:hypothetical protein